MEALVSYRVEAAIATVAMDDGKVNALSPRMQSELRAALDRAEADAVAAVVLTGRAGVFSAGFDLAVLKAGGAEAAAMLRGGFELASRLLGFPVPVVIACSGHVIAMGLFVAQAGDYRIGVVGTPKIVANEVAIGMTMPRAAIELCRSRLAPGCLHRTLALAEPFSPEDAVAGGLLDRVVAPAELAATAQAAAGVLGKLDRTAHRETKLRMRQPLLDTLARAIEADDAEFRARSGL